MLYAFAKKIRKLIPKPIRRRLAPFTRNFGSPEQRAAGLLHKTGERFTPKFHSFPPMVMIDTTTRCNLACTHCPNSALSIDKSWVGDIDEELYKKLIDEIARENVNTVVRPFDGGEPLMLKKIEAYIKYAKEAGIQYVSINTNGQLLSEKRAIKLLESKLDHLEVSIDAFSAETYQKIRNSDRYENLVENILRLDALRKRLNASLRIDVSFVEQSGNRHEANLFENFWENKIDVVSIRPLHQHHGLVENCGTTMKSHTYRHPCPYLWNRIIVNHDGRVRFCENDWKGEHAVGNANTQSLKEIWHGEAYTKLRSSHVEGTFDHPYCFGCKDWSVIQW